MVLYNIIKNTWGVDDMTKENYISYLIGTVNGYPAKLQRHLKKLFTDAGIIVSDDQMRIPLEVDNIVNTKDTELSDQLTRCLEESESAQRIFEKWEFEKDYKYSVLFTTSQFSTLLPKLYSLVQYNKNHSEASRSSNDFTSPLCLQDDNFVFLKFIKYYSAVDPATGNEFLLKYPILIVLHCKEQFIEFRFDTLRRIFVPERQEQTFYSDLISKLRNFCHTFFEIDI